MSRRYSVRTITAGLLVILGVSSPLFVPQPAFAHQPQPFSAYQTKVNSDGHTIRWVQDTIVMKLSPDFAERFGADEALHAARCAAAAWGGIPGVPEIRVVMANLKDFNEHERENGIHLKNSWIREADELALTFTSSTPAGHVVGSDIVVNGEKELGVLVVGDTPTGKYDLQSILTHEFGHVLGLGESWNSFEATMHPEIGRDETFRRTISEDDTEGVLEIYHVPHDEVSTCSYLGGASGGPLGPFLWLLVGLCALGRSQRSPGRLGISSAGR